MRLNEYASTRRTRGSYKIPTSVQKSIPIDEIYADGTWRSGEVYSQMWSVSDINYAMQSDDKKQDILAKMGRIYSNIPTDCWAQLCIVSQRMDEISFERDVLYHRANDGLDAYRVERNRLMKAYAKEIGNVKQQKYLILSTNKQNSKHMGATQHIPAHINPVLVFLRDSVVDEQRQIENGADRRKARFVCHTAVAGGQLHIRIGVAAPCGGNVCQRSFQGFSLRSYLI